MSSELAPPPLAVPRPPQAQGLHRVRGVARHHAHHRRHPAHRARRRRQRDRRPTSRALWPLLALLVGLGAVNFVLSYIRRFVGGRFAFDVQHDLRTTIFERVQRLDFAHHDQLPTGQLVSRASSDLALVQALLSFLPLATGNVVLLVLSLVVMLVPLAAAHAGRARRSCPRCCSCRCGCGGVMFPAQWDALQRAGEVAGVVDEAVSGVRVVKGFGQEDRELGRASPTPPRASTARRVRTVRLQARYQSGAAGHPGPRPGRRCSRSAGGWRSQGEISIGTFLAFSTYLVQLLAPVRMFAGHGGGRRSRRARAPSGSSSCIDSNPLVTERPDAQPTCRRPRVEITFDHVSYGYLALGAGAARLLAARRAGRDGRAGRRIGLGQVDGQPAPPPLLRRAGRRDPRRRRRRARRHPRLACAARSASCSRTRSSSPTPCAPTSRTAVPTPPTPRSSRRPRIAGAHEFVTELPARLRHRGRRARAHALGRPAPAHLASRAR